MNFFANFSPWILALFLLANIDVSNGFIVPTTSNSSNNNVKSGVVFEEMSTLADNSSMTTRNTTTTMKSIPVRSTFELISNEPMSSTTSKPLLLSSGNGQNQDDNIVNNKVMAVKLAEKIPNLPKFKPKREPEKVKTEEYSDKNLTNAWVSAESELLERNDNEEDVEFGNNNSTVQPIGLDFYRDECQFCPEARYMQHYFSKGCIAMELQVKCVPRFCPKYFECPKEEELPKDGCRHNSVMYQFGDLVPLADPCQHCRCINSTNGAQLNCAIDECFNSWNEIAPNCYRKYTEGKCCPDIVCLDGDLANQTLPTCSFEGKSHKFGDYFSPNDDPCFNCLCDDKWNRSMAAVNNVESELKLDKACKRIECNIDQDRAEHQHCVPVYSDKACCPVYYHCPEEHHNKDSNEPKCKFGENTYQIGEKVKLKQHEICLDCTCLVPPEITCKHKSCLPKPENCSSIYDEGECCPRFNCDDISTSTTDNNNTTTTTINRSTTPASIEDDEESGESESETLNEENSESSHHFVEKVEEEHHQIIRKCSPIEECKEPCKLVIEHDHDDDDDDDEDTDQEARSHHEKVPKCPICRCNLDPATLKAIEIIDNKMMSMENETKSTTVGTTTTTETTAEQQLASSISSTIVNATTTTLINSATEIEQVPASTTTTPTTTKSPVVIVRTGKRCPDIACEYPCYIYQSSALMSCPQCSCQDGQDSPDVQNRMRNHNNNTKSFLATRNLTIRT